MTVALVTGANRGIGFHTAQQLVGQGRVVDLGARSAERGAPAAARIGARFVQLDVTDDASVHAALTSIDDAEGRLDLLVNNAGVLETELSGPSALRAFDTNAVGIVRVTEAALPLLRKSSDPTVVTISSSAGSFWAVTNPRRPEYALVAPLYSASKAAATMLTLQYAKAYPEISFNALEPGTTATDLGSHGPTATLRDESRDLPW